MSSEILSPVERKILFGFVFLICCIYFLNVSNEFISSYNEAVQSEQLEKQRIANNEKGFSFDIYGGYGMPLYETILALQFLTIPLLLFSLRKQNFRKFLFSLFLTGFTLFGYLSWAFKTYWLRKFSEGFFKENFSFNTFVLFNSTALDFIMFLAFSILFVAFSAILLRFTIEKFQVKIP